MGPTTPRDRMDSAGTGEAEGEVGGGEVLQVMVVVGLAWMWTNFCLTSYLGLIFPSKVQCLFC